MTDQLVNAYSHTAASAVSATNSDRGEAVYASAHTGQGVMAFSDTNNAVEGHTNSELAN